MLPFVSYRIARETPLPPIGASMYEYVLAGNGLFVRGQREGLGVLLPVAPCRVRGLAPVEPFVELDHPRVPAALVNEMLRISLRARNDQGLPSEVVFHLSWDGSRWQLEVPEQERDFAHAQPLGPAMGSSYARALAEVHSHHGMAAIPSSVDSAEETGFRIFGVLGSIYTQPSLFVRVGVFGHFWTIPAGLVFELPAGIADQTATEHNHGEA